MLKVYSTMWMTIYHVTWMSDINRYVPVQVSETADVDINVVPYLDLHMTNDLSL